MAKKKVLVCGATGFIGRNTVLHLCERPDLEVYGTYYNSEVPDSFKIRPIEMIRADLRDKSTVNKITKDKDVIIQMASVTSGSKDVVTQPHIHITDPVIINSLIFRAAHDNKVPHVLFPSCTVMYQSSSTPVKETDFDANSDIYPKYFGGAWNKIYLEKMCEFYSRQGNTKYTAFRHSNIYGPHDKFDLEKSHMFGATMTKVMTANSGDSIEVWGTGGEERDLLYVSDLVDFMEKAMDQQETPFELVNIGYGSSISVGNLVKKVIKASGKDLTIRYNLSKPTINVSFALDCTKAKELFNWEPQITLDQGIERTMNLYRVYGR